jgi:hypothetical protein
MHTLHLTAIKQQGELMEDILDRCNRFGIELSDEVKEAAELQQTILELEREREAADDGGYDTTVHDVALRKLRRRLKEIVESIDE